MKNKTFNLTLEHVQLLRRFIVSWDGCEFGAPSIDCKRPYGNRDVYGDMAKILGIEWKRDEDDDYMPNALRERLDKLHKEMETALQIVLTTGSYILGKYEASEYGRDWRKVE